MPSIRCSGLMLALNILTSACQQNFCERAEQLDEACGAEVSDTLVDACKESLDTCSRKDEERLQSWLDCMVHAGVYECESEFGTATEEAQIFNALSACSGELDGLSSSCKPTNS